MTHRRHQLIDQVFQDERIMDEFDAVLDLKSRRILERWVGYYASAPDRLTDREYPMGTIGW